MDLALVETEIEATNRTIIGFHGVMVLSENPIATKRLFTCDLGLDLVSENHFVTDSSSAQHLIVNKEPLRKGRWGAGTVHHLAWSVENTAELMAWQDYFYHQQMAITEIKNRKYFESIYLQEKGNVIFEFATVEPGLKVDESFEKLGQTLQIPPHFLEQKEAILGNIEPINAHINSYLS